MNLVFNFGLFFLALYMFMDVAVQGSGASRLEVQLVAGAGLGVMLLYSGHYLLSSYRITKHWPFIKQWMAFVGLMLVYYLISLVDLPTSLAQPLHRNLLIAIYILVGILFIYHGAVRGHLSERKTSWLIVSLLINGAFEIYLARSALRTVNDVDLVNTSAGYVFVMLAPLLMYKYQKNCVWIFGVTLILTIMTGKRGAMVIYGFLIIYSLMNFQVIKRYTPINLRSILLIILLFIATLLVVESSWESMQYRFETIRDDERGTLASGRDIIWGGLLKYWVDGDASQFFWGNGFYSTISIVGFFAHNDFIEFLVNMGGFGLVLYLIVLWRFYRSVIIIKKLDSYIGFLLMTCLLILVGRGLISGTIRTDSINLSISIGYLLAVATMRKRMILGD